MDFNNIDYIVMVIVGVSMIIGFFRGFMGSVFSSIGWLLSLYLAYVMLPRATGMLSSKISSPIILMTVGYSASLLIMLILSGILNIFIIKAIDSLRFGLFDRVLGLAFGAVRGGFVIGIIYCVFVMFWNLTNADDYSKMALLKDDSKYPGFITDAYTHKFMKNSRDVIVGLLPNNFDEQVVDFYKSLAPEKDIEPKANDLGKNLSEKAKKDSQKYLDSLDDNLDDGLIDDFVESEKADK